MLPRPKRFMLSKDLVKNNFPKSLFLTVKPFVLVEV
jgi:hypothetical protein